MRLSNIYDIEQDTKSTMLLLKFHRNEEKYQLLLESGIRMHLTEYTRDKQGSPSNFNAKLRKHLKSKRLTGLAQIDNGDRKVNFTFGEDEYAHHLIVRLWTYTTQII
jgi:predicted ribosome quality control (RQC) complex YloA/Tae2 family protein